MIRLRQYRFLIIVASLAFFFGLWEVTHKSSSDPTPAGSSGGAARMTDLPPDRRVFVQVFPHSSNSEFDLGLEFYNRQEYDEALKHFREALAPGVKTNEDLLWQYILTLMHVGADEAEVNAAIASWRRNFPHSDKYSAPYWTYSIELLDANAPEQKIDAAVTNWRGAAAEKAMPDPYWAAAVRMVQRRAPSADVDAAVSRWRRKSPHSTQPDPRRTPTMRP